jgi:hypothetical protein
MRAAYRVLFALLALGVALLLLQLGLKRSDRLPRSDRSPRTARSPAAAPSAGSPAAGGAAVEIPITAAALRAHVQFLADDALEGRGTGTRGHELAAKYVRAVLSAAGLRSGTADGSFLQRVPLRRAVPQPAGCSVVLTQTGAATAAASAPRALVYDTDYVMPDTHAAERESVSAPVVFAGYGVTAPEAGYDDYAQVDARGKVVVVLFDVPRSFTGRSRAYYTDLKVKRDTAAAHGAVGLFVLMTPAWEARVPWDLARREVLQGLNSLRWIDESGASGASGRVHGLEAPVRVHVMLSRSGGEALFAGEAQSLAAIFAAVEADKVRSFALNKTAAVRTHSRHTQVESSNVIALLPGSDPALKDEYVAFTAHVDHLGIGAAVDGDTIYNGAADNAAGTALLLEVARALAASRERPRRSLLFIGTTAEETGLVGSDYFVHNPTVPLDRIVAALNIDGGIGLVPVRDVIPQGAEHSTLGALARQAAAASGLEVSPDPIPDEVLFTLTDHYSFIRKGVPALWIELGTKSSDPAVDALASFQTWYGSVYHSPKDDARQPLDYETSARLGQLLVRLGLATAAQPERPRWTPGDFFAAKFAGARREGAGLTPAARAPGAR